ncbi:PPOX class probable F420-dependent enzyme [Pedococcus dokdonensis]|uniref:PPOX class probable F420-dependent enzyme n=1 Tax=Pedococcus dokdonensis TaxID=443156 RepID=A0A1H0KZW0_9MICO|nr:PPOX class F420-dependent oxidoreductase [Pedococcus dokdonensis]SDO61508.1 PPOX class probable F420-dependent enzyme [Pedococcus dokdonensis]
MVSATAFDPALLALASSRRIGALAALKRDGRPQLSMVNHTLDTSDPAAPRVRVSVVDGRAKVANLLRDPRGSLLVTSEEGWSYAVLEGDVSFSPVAQAADDEVVEELVELYRTIRGADHPDWADYRRAMVEDGRRILRLQVTRVYGLVQ